MKTLRLPLAAFVTALAAVLLAVPLTASPAAAHTLLLSSDPEDGAALDEAPATAVLTFNERLDEPSTRVAVTDAAGATLPSSFTVDGAELTVALDLPGAGTYTIGYRIVSADGHRVDGTVTFGVGGAEGAAPTGSNPAAGPERGVDAETREGEGDGGAVLLIIGAIAVAALVAGGVVLARGRRRSAG